MRRLRRQLGWFGLVAAIVALTLAANLASAAFVPSGDWTNTGSSTFGYTAGNTAGVSGGATIDVGATTPAGSYPIELGYVSGGSGTLDASGGTLNGVTNLYAGYFGVGTLSVGSAGSLSTTNGFVGYNGGATGAAYVDGATTRWENIAMLAVGGGGTVTSSANGAGTLRITNGAVVSDSSGYIGWNAGAAGTVTVDGTGGTSKWTSTSGTLVVGGSGSGTLNIVSGGSVSSANTYIAYYPGGSGAVYVDGASRLTNTSSVFVGGGSVTGALGAGTLNISNGGFVSGVGVYLAYLAGSSGTLNMANGGTISGECNVGQSGNGVLNFSGSLGSVTGGILVANVLGSTGMINFGPSAGTLTARTFQAAGSQMTGSGVVNSRGFVVDDNWTLNATNLPSALQVLKLPTSDGGTVTVNVDLSGSSTTNGWIGAGWRSSGTLTVDGIYLGVQGLRVGWGPAAVGKFYLQNAGTLATASTTQIGGNGGGNGTASVSNNSLFSNTGVLMLANYGGTGTLNVLSGGTVSATGETRLPQWGTGLVFVDGAGSKFSGAGTMYIGGQSSANPASYGTITISNGGSVTGSTGCNTSYGVGSVAVIKVDGAGSKFGIAGNFSAGFSANSTISVNASNGGLWANTSGTLQLGYGGSSTGLMSVTNGGTVSQTGGVYIAYGTNSRGTATVDGAGATAGTTKLTSSSTLYVGNSGPGVLKIYNGGYVSSVGGYVGNSATPLGGSSAVVDGAGSVWNSTGAIYVGYTGLGSLSITNDASVSATHLYVGRASGGTGTLTVGAGASITCAGSVTVASGSLLDLGAYSPTFGSVTLIAGTIAASAGGTVSSSVGYGAQSGLISANLAGAVNLTKTTAGTVVLSGSNSYSAYNYVQAGTLEFAGPAAMPGLGTNAALVTVSSAATLAVAVGGAGWQTADVTSLLAQPSVSYTDSTAALGFDTANVGADGAFTVADNLVGARALRKLGVGTLVLTGTNTYTGYNYVQAGILKFAGPAAMPGLSTNTALVTVSPAATLAVAVGGAGWQSADVTSLLAQPSISYADSTAVLGFDTANVGASGAFTVADNLTGAYALRKLGVGTLVFTGTNTYAGRSYVQAGTLKFASPAAMPGIGWYAAQASVSAGATLAVAVGGAGWQAADVTSLLVQPSISYADSTAALGFDTTNVGGTGSFTVVDSIAGNYGVTKLGAGKLVFTGANNYTGRTVVQAGTLELDPAAQSTVLSGGGVDLQHGKLVFDYIEGADPAATIAAKLGLSYHGGQWDVSPFYITDEGPHPLHSLGWLDDTVSHQVIVMWTLYGDANLDGTVNGADLNTVLSNYNQAGNWNHGDFNYDGTVNGGDLNTVLSNYNQSLSVGAAVPEPSMLLLAAAGLTALLAYRWRKRA
jgi:T5SS/PEP-CTERM-associated repeat protein/autotransporter-associated beta strand protein